MPLPLPTSDLEVPTPTTARCSPIWIFWGGVLHMKDPPLIPSQSDLCFSSKWDTQFWYSLYELLQINAHMCARETWIFDLSQDSTHTSRKDVEITAASANELKSPDGSQMAESLQRPQKDSLHSCVWKLNPSWFLVGRSVFLYPTTEEWMYSTIFLCILLDIVFFFPTRYNKFFFFHQECVVL